MGAAEEIAADLFAATRKPTKDSLIVHCLGRAYPAANGWEESEGQARAGRFKVNQWKAARVAPKATRVALFVASWAAAMAAEGRDDYTITEYARFWRETERVAYRLQGEFRELWPGHATPDQLARQIVKQRSLRLEQDEGGKAAPFPISVEVTA